MNLIEDINKKTERKFLIVYVIPAFVLVSLLIYFDSFFYGFRNYDDHVYIGYLNNILDNGVSLGAIKSIITDFVNANWHPVTMMSLAVDYLVGNNNPIYFHITNTIIHTLNALIVYAVFNKISLNKLVSFVAALVFIIHPLNVESVIWVSERKGLLSALFALLSIYYYIYHKSDPKIAFKILSVIAFALSLLSKPTTATIPFVFVVMEFTIYREKRILSYNLNDYKLIFLNVFPYFIVLTSIIFFLFIAQYETGALRDIATVSIQERFAASINNIFTYISKIFLPVNLASYYPRTEVSYHIVFIYIIIMISWLAVGLKYYSNSKMFVFCVLFFLIQILPMSGLFQTGSHSIANRYTYLPSVGIFFIVSLILVNSKYKRYSYAFMFIIFSLLLYSSVEQRKVWRTNLSMWENNANSTESNYVSAYYYSKALVEDGQAEKAFAFFFDTIGTKNDFFAGRMVSNMAAVFIEHQYLQAARKILEKGINNKLEDSGLHRQIAFLDYFYFNMKKSGLKQILVALKLYPDNYNVNRIYSKMLFEQKKYQEALNVLNKMLEIQQTKDEKQNKLIIKQDIELILKAMN